MTPPFPCFLAPLNWAGLFVLRRRRGAAPYALVREPVGPVLWWQHREPFLTVRTSKFGHPRVQVFAGVITGASKWSSTQRTGVNALQRCAKLPIKQKIRSPKEPCLGLRTITTCSPANSKIVKNGRSEALDIPRAGQFTDLFESPLHAGLRTQQR
jgi:hypothetical protein